MERHKINSLTLSHRRKQIFLTIGVITVVSAAASGVFSLFNLADSPSAVRFLEGAAVGAVVAFCAATTEFFLYTLA